MRCLDLFCCQPEGLEARVPSQLAIYPAGSMCHKRICQSKYFDVSQIWLCSLFNYGCELYVLRVLCVKLLLNRESVSPPPQERGVEAKRSVPSSKSSRCSALNWARILNLETFFGLLFDIFFFSVNKGPAPAFALALWKPLETSAEQTALRVSVIS